MGGLSVTVRLQSVTHPLSLMTAVLLKPPFQHVDYLRTTSSPCMKATLWGWRSVLLHLYISYSYRKKSFCWEEAVQVHPLTLSKTELVCFQVNLIVLWARIYPISAKISPIDSSPLTLVSFYSGVPDRECDQCLGL